jgi:hypothetical protein
MDMNEVVASTWQHNVLSFFAAALLAVVGVGAPAVSAAECYPHCKRVQPDLYGDPRCGPRDLVTQPLSTPFPTFETKGSRCDFGEPRRHAGPPAVAATPQTPSHPASSVRHVLPVTGANEPVIGASGSATGAGGTGTGASDPGRSRSGFERDVGFNDAFGTRVDEFRTAPRAPAGAGGVGGAAGVGIGAGVGGAGGAIHGRP